MSDSESDSGFADGGSADDATGQPGEADGGGGFGDRTEEGDTTPGGGFGDSDDGPDEGEPPRPDRYWKRGQALAIGGLVLASGGFASFVELAGYTTESVGVIVVGVVLVAGSVHEFSVAQRAELAVHDRQIADQLDDIETAVEASEYQALIDELAKQRQAAEELSEKLPQQQQQIESLLSTIDEQDSVLTDLVDQIQKAEREKLDALEAATDEL